MLRVRKADLPAKLAAWLAAKQHSIAELTEYAAQVAQAAVLWDRKGEFAAIRAALAQQCSGLQRCQYCEDSAADEIEHVWPKKYYPGKTFVWDNYLYVCGRCNGSHKRARWALFGAAGGFVELVREKGSTPTPPPDGAPVFIDPHVDDPLDFIELELETGLFLPIGEEGTVQYLRAEYTINVLGLNERDFLSRARRNAYADYLENVRDYLEAKELGAGDEVYQLQRLVARQHATVWAEVKRRAKAGGAHQQLFAVAPALWAIG